MSNFKELITSAALDPYHKRENGIIHYMQSPSKIALEFFNFMQSTGYNLYNSTDYLREIIMSYSTKLINELKIEDNSLTDGRNYKVAPKLTKAVLQNLQWKWQGNIMEIIAGNMFSQNCHPFTNKYTFSEWVGNSKEDAGVDGWLKHAAKGNNSKFFIGVQVKYRFEKSVKWNDQITKAVALTDERVRTLFRDGQLTKDEWIDWGLNVNRRALIVTTTKVSDSITSAIGSQAFDKIDEDDLLKYLGCPNNKNQNKTFWENTYKSIIGD